MTISQNYIDKNIDICVLETSALPGPADVFVGWATSGTVIAGPYKVVQKFVKFLLTERGSVPADTSYGTLFISKLMAGQIFSEVSLSLEFYAELSDILNYIDSSELNPSPDEALSRVTLQSISVSSDSATIKILFEFQNSSTILAPVSISTV
jgi:hypothetical protein